MNPLAWPCAGAPALKYGYVNIEASSPGEVKGLIDIYFLININKLFRIFFYFNKKIKKIYL